MSISGLRKLLEDNEEYPPSEILWQQIIDLTKKKTKKDEFKSIQLKMQQETEHYKPSLPEPYLTRVFFQGEYYFIDGKDQIYRADPANPLVGTLTGKITKSHENPDDPDSPVVYKVIINNQTVHEIKPVSLKPQKIHHRKYYLDRHRKVFRGLHPQRNYVHKIGFLNDQGKIQLNLSNANLEALQD